MICIACEEKFEWSDDYLMIKTDTSKIKDDYFELELDSIYITLVDSPNIKVDEVISLELTKNDKYLNIGLTYDNLTELHNYLGNKLKEIEKFS